MDSIEDHRSEEVDQPEQESSNDVGTGRSYECMFCKRGFTTAQALGGHMNIHRKDRAKTSRPNSSTKHVEETNYAGPRIYQPVFSSYPPPYFAAHEAQFRYQTYVPSNSSITQLSYDQNNHNYNRYSSEQSQHQIISPCGEDLRMGLSLQFGSSYEEDMDQRKSYRVRNYEEDGLDLELRLGHEP